MLTHSSSSPSEWIGSKFSSVTGKSCGMGKTNQSSSSATHSSPTNGISMSSCAAASPPSPFDAYIPSRYARPPIHRSPLHFLMVLSIVYLCFRHAWSIKLISEDQNWYIKKSPHFRKPWWIFAQLGSIGLDMHDEQWRSLFDNSPILLSVIAVVVGISRTLRSKYPALNNRAVVVNGAPSHAGGGGSCGGGDHEHNEFSNNDSTGVVMNPWNGDSVERAGGGASEKKTVHLVNDSPTLTNGGAGAANGSAGANLNLLSMFYFKNSPGGSTPLAVFHMIAGLVFATVLHGPRIFFMLAIALANYYVIAPLCKRLPSRAWLAVLWSFHVGILFLNEAFGGYSFAVGGSGSPAILHWLDAMPQLLRWTLIFNMCTLRMIAYCVDYDEALHRCGGSNSNENSGAAAAAGSGDNAMRARLEEKHRSNCLECVSTRRPCYKLRTDVPRPISEYTSLVHYLAYLFYIPLYIAGPMTSFNAFVSHIYAPQQWFKRAHAVRYAARTAGYIGLLFTVLHFEHLLILKFVPNVYTVSMERIGIDVRCAMFLQTLAVVWLKFSVIWRTFRLAALLDGFDVPEDMGKSYCGATTVSNFWRDWHSSFNLWIIRYMYIPLGGNKSKALAIVPIFLFIAVWHDIKLQLVYWALAICLVFIPETIIISYFSQKRFDWFRDKPYYFAARAAGTSVTLFSLIVANMLGYGTGQSSVKDAHNTIMSISTDGKLFVVYLPICAFVNWRARDVRYEAERRARWELGLPIDASENLKNEAQLSCIC